MKKLLFVLIFPGCMCWKELPRQDKADIIITSGSIIANALAIFFLTKT